MLVVAAEAGAEDAHDLDKMSKSGMVDMEHEAQDSHSKDVGPGQTYD